MAKDIIINLKLDDKEISAKILNADKLVNQLRQSATKTGDSFLKWSVITTGFNQAMSLGRQAFAVMDQLITPFLTFEKGMANVQSIVKLSGKDFEELGDGVLQLQKDLGVSSETLTGGLYDLVSAGVKAEDALSVLEVAARSSIAGVTDTKVAADGLTTVLNAFHYEASRVGEVADIMFKTVELGKTTFEELAGSLSEVAPIAASTGISFEEIGGAIATLTKQGVPTSTAVTQIRASIIALNDILGDGWAETMSYQEAVQLLNERAAGSPKILKEMIGRVEGVNAVLGLTGKNLEMAASDLNLVTDSSGAMGEAFEINSNTVERKIAQLSESFNVLLIETIGKLEPTLQGAIEAGGSLVTTIEDIAKVLEDIYNSDAYQVLEFLYSNVGGGAITKYPKMAFEEVVGLFKDSEEEIEKVNDGLSWMNENLRYAGNEIVRIVPEIKTLNEEFKKAPQTVNDIKKEIQDLEQSVGDLVPGTQKYFETLEKLENLKAKISTAKKQKTEAPELPGIPIDESGLDELAKFAEEQAEEESQRLIELSDLKMALFEEEQIRNEEEMFQNEMLYYSREELLNKEIDLETQRYNLMEQLRKAETADEVEQLKKQKQIVDKRIENIKQEVAARDEFTKQSILAGIQMYDSTRSLGEQLKQLARDSIKRIIAEAVATQIAKVIAMVPWPFNLFVAPAAGLAVSALFDKLIPPFETGGLISGRRHSSGGEIINAEGGEFIVNREATRSNISLLEGINSGRNIAVASAGGNSDVIASIKYLGDEIRNLKVIAKLSPREFDEGYSDYLLKKNHTG